MAKFPAFRLLVAVAAAAIIGAATTTSALAAGPVPNASGQNCVSLLSAPDRTTGASAVAATTCFQTFADAIRFATKGSIDVPDGLKPSDVTDAFLALAAPSTTVVIGIDWQDIDMGGPSRVWEASSGCSSGLSWIVNQIEPAWDNRVSSGKGDTNCNRYEHYDLPNRTGVLIACTPYCAEMGIMNDRTSSLWFKFS